MPLQWGLKEKGGKRRGEASPGCVSLKETCQRGVSFSIPSSPKKTRKKERVTPMGDKKGSCLQNSQKVGPDGRKGLLLVKLRVDYLLKAGGKSGEVEDRGGVES